MLKGLLANEKQFPNQMTSYKDIEILQKAPNMLLSLAVEFLTNLERQKFPSKLEVLFSGGYTHVISGYRQILQSFRIIGSFWDWHPGEFGF